MLNNIDLSLFPLCACMICHAASHPSDHLLSWSHLQYKSVVSTSLLQHASHLLCLRARGLHSSESDSSSLHTSLA